MGLVTFDLSNPLKNEPFCSAAPKGCAEQAGTVWDGMYGPFLRIRTNSMIGEKRKRREPRVPYTFHIGMVF